MENYDGTQPGMGTHNIRIHLQDGKYKGYFDKEIGGNCKGITVLTFDFEELDPEDFRHLKMHNLEISPIGPNYDDWWLNVKIYDGDNHTDWVECEYEACELNDMVVGIEIVDYKEEPEK